MESNGLLDIDNDQHMFELRLVFQARMPTFMSSEDWRGWNCNHSLSAEQNMSPIQLLLGSPWIFNMRGPTATNSMFEYILFELKSFIFSNHVPAGNMSLQATLPSIVFLQNGYRGPGMD